MGEACKEFLNREMQDLVLGHVQIDELFTYVRKKRYNRTGDEIDADRIGEFMLFIAFDEETKLVPIHLVGRRKGKVAKRFLRDLASRLRIPKPHESDDHAFVDGNYHPVLRISTDGYQPYKEAVHEAFSPYVEYGQLQKKTTGRGKNRKTKIRRQIFFGEDTPEAISTSLVERNNATLRLFIRPLVRKTLAFSKKLENLQALTALYMAHYNYCRIHRTLKTTPAVAANIAGKPFKLRELYDHIRQCAPELVWG
ncbi:MAG: IS1 transposase [Planctomycetota bacterium]|nr:MAG: IS1 transposase [Planctomycetota bacterium]REJ87991.1 MAG: IS1 transposase [Planctomycetota bacterium]REK24812.1 MAG: IS1 transposase [Planctomycetota bacterium]REK49428.1 MAG: IS1 transposase [Planctomycetota bacterium]